jgi:hypothetical protein
VTQRPQETLRQLCEIFPSFDAWWQKEEVHPPTEDGPVDGVYYEWTHHAVMSQFLIFFSLNQNAFAAEQLRQFGAWVDQVIATRDDLENAVSTCFLEHTRQVKASRILAPYLSRAAKRHA